MTVIISLEELYAVPISACVVRSIDRAIDDCRCVSIIRGGFVNDGDCFLHSAVVVLARTGGSISSQLASLHRQQELVEYMRPRLPSFQARPFNTMCIPFDPLQCIHTSAVCIEAT